MAKDIYKTFKRSISGIAGGNNINGESSSSPSTSSANVKYRGGSGRTWIHPPDYLINGRVEYVARFMGCVETAKPHGSDVAREAVHAIRFQRDVKRSEQTRETAKLQKVDIRISIDNVEIVDTKTKVMLYTFPLGRISFCADDKDDKRMFSFIARGEGSEAKHSCYAFTSEKLAEDITLTIGEAFDLAYKRFLDKNRTSLENQKQVIILRKKIAELETENQVLIERLAAAMRANTKVEDDHSNFPLIPGIGPPALPLSPMPQGPPPNVPSSIYSMPVNDHSTPPTEMAPRLPPISTSPSGQSPAASPASTSSSGPAPSIPPPRPPAIAPPPPVAPRRNIVVSPKTTSAGQLNGLNLGESNKTTKNVFDDTFDPRAGEKKSVTEESSAEYNPFGSDFLSSIQNRSSTPPSVSAALLASEAISQLPQPSKTQPKKTAAEYDDMINELDKKLEAISIATFEFGPLQTGDLGGMEGESEYGTPSDRLNPKVMNLKE